MRRAAMAKAGMLSVVVLAVVLVAPSALHGHGSRRAVAASGGVTFTDYMTYDETVAYLRALRQRYPGRVALASAGKTVEGRDMWLARVSDGAVDNPVMLVDGLMHAREWIVLPAALYLLSRVAETPVPGLDVVVMPIMNADGYEYSRTTDRLWRKNRGLTFNETCVGIDLNRNFDAWWDYFKINGGASSDPCDLFYAGPKAASEPETQNFQKLVLSLNANKRLKMYVNLHSPEQSIYLPWGYSNTTARVPDYSKLETIANEANAAMVKAGATKYTVESMGISYPATGTVTDWARSKAGIAQTFCVELPAGGPDALKGFGVPKTKILTIARQLFEAMKVFIKYAKAPLSQ